jgi:hypothetical protein
MNRLELQGSTIFDMKRKNDASGRIESEPKEHIIDYLLPVSHIFDRKRKNTDASGRIESEPKKENHCLLRMSNIFDWKRRKNEQ